MSSYRTYEEWKLQPIEAKELKPTVLTVPMRNGNSSVVLLPRMRLPSSYRTYEEWKPSKGISFTRLQKGSYRTYEEWKQVVTILIHTNFNAGSYRTYEEWKLVNKKFCMSLISVLTVPMRNGNKMKEKELLNMKKVLTVPMRNGNVELLRNPLHCGEFLPYL